MLFAATRSVSARFHLPIISTLIITAITIFSFGNTAFALPGQNSSDKRASNRGTPENTPVRYTENRGQIIDTDGNSRPDVRFIASIGGVKLYLRNTGISHVFNKIERDQPLISEATGQKESMDGESGAVSERIIRQRVDMDFIGSNPFPRIRAEGVLPGVSHYYYAHCPDGILNVESYERIVYEDLYPGIDAIFSSKDGRLKYDFLVHPGADVSAIRLRYNGAEAVDLTSSGSLLVLGEFGSIEEHAPVSMQTGRRIPTLYHVDGDEIGFDIGTIDTSKPLLIDPWATYHGGSLDERGQGIEVAANGDIVISGNTGSIDFPVLNAFQGTSGGVGDAFAAKYSSAGSLLWATYYGGSSSDESLDAAISSSGTIAVGGITSSVDFPVQNAAQNIIGGGQDAFVIQLSGNGTRNWATYYGGNERENAPGIGCDAAGNVFQSGVSSSVDFPVVNAYQNTLNGGQDITIVKFSSSGSVEWATYFGGSDSDYNGGLDVDGNGCPVAAGRTNSTDFPLKNASQSTHAGSADSYVVRMTSSGALDWSTYFGGSGYEAMMHVACDGTRAVALYAETSSDDLPVKNAFQGVRAGSSDVFVVHFDYSGSVNWATYLGGSSNENSGGTAFDDAGDLYCGGLTLSADFPLQNAQQTGIAGLSDIFVTRFSSTGTVIWSSLYGGSAEDYCEEIAADGNAGLRVIGSTYSADFPVPGAHQGTSGGTNDALLISLAPDGTLVTPPPAPSSLTATALSGVRVQLNWVDNSSSESAFVVEYRVGAGSWIEAGTTLPNATTFVVEYLMYETEHSFRVKARNVMVDSPPSNEATATTLEFPPPRNLTAVGHAFDAISLTWIDSTLDETHFIIEYQEGVGQWMSGANIPANREQAVVDGFQQSTTYSLRMKAVAGTISSAYSSIVQATTKKFLEAPMNLVGTVLTANSVELNWEDKSSGETGFEIEQRLQGESWLLGYTTTEDVSAYTITGLTADTIYSFRVRAVGDDAASAYSNIETVITRLPPSPPIDFLSTAVDYRSVRLNWQRGSTNEDYYEIERKMDGGSWSQVHTAGAGETTLLDEPLEQKTTYWYRARALNSIGTSAWSNEDSAWTYPIPLPAAPFGVSAESTGPNSIHLTWINPHPSYQDGVEIEESLTGDENDFTLVSTVAAGTTKHEQDNLQPGTEYYYRLRAYNSSGYSVYSKTVSAKTDTQHVDLPAIPGNVTATALSTSEIRIDWSMPDPSKEEGFELERSLTDNPNDFIRLDPDPPLGTRSYTDDGLTESTKYYYRLRAWNKDGKSGWSDIVNATTHSEPMSEDLRLALESKESMFPGIEKLIPDGDARMQTLRDMLGNYPRGYDESAARTLIADWRAAFPQDQPTAAEALKRYALIEQLMADCIGDGKAGSLMPGARLPAGQAGKAPALCVKDLGSLGLSWKQERSYLGEENDYLDKALEDLSLSVFDGASTLLMLTGANTDAGVSDFYSDVVTKKGEVKDLTSTVLLGLMDYYEEALLARFYLPATQPLITTFADRTEQLDVAGEYDSALTRYTSYLAKVKTETGAFNGTFDKYNAICTGLDVAFLIQQASSKELPEYLKALMPARERMIDRMWKAVTHAEIPILRSLYLTTSPAVSAIGSLPADLLNAGNSIFDPTISGFRGSGDGTLRKQTSILYTFINSDVIDNDRDLLLDLRAKVLASDTAYISAEFDDIRLCGSQVYSELDRQLRPLFGIPAESLYPDADLRGDYYRTIGYAHRTKARRTVLSLSLADYRLDPTEQKQTTLVAEIDTILVYIPGAITLITNISTRTQSLLSRPVLALDDAWLNADPSGGSERYSFRFDVKNVGGTETTSADLKVSTLTADVVLIGTGEYQAGALGASSLYTDSLAVDIPQGVKVVTFSIAMSIKGGQTYVDQVTLPVPQMPTGIIDSPPVARSIELYQNYPNPFNPTTTISYSLPERIEVSMVVIDPLGREVRRIFSGQQHDSGRHSVQFDAGELPSSIYFYRLTTPETRITRKMLLVR